MGASLHYLCMPRAVGRKAGFDVLTSHISSRGELTADWAGDSIATQCQGDLGIFFCSMAGATLLCMGLSLTLLKQKP